ncbi:hypothetical protein BDY24DRAFT_389174 [Mrakia frigida]|uniref:uncharacterized protein n=1 Tax=Mrakia frigida TaxID=29902 RepID=UPI003FCC1157
MPSLSTLDPPTTTTSSSISPFLTLPTLLLLLSSPSSPPPTVPLLSALVHLLASHPPSTPLPEATPTLHQARMALATLLTTEGRLVEAESEWTGMELAARSRKKGGKKERAEGEVETTAEYGEIEDEPKRKRSEWLESVMGLVGCLERLGRGGRAKQWRRKLEDEEEREKAVVAGALEPSE